MVLGDWGVMVEQSSSHHGYQEAENVLAHLLSPRLMSFVPSDSKIVSLRLRVCFTISNHLIKQFHRHTQRWASQYSRCVSI